MSVIGTIVVHQCDGCRKTAVVHTEEDIASFASNWYEGLLVDFCTDCKDKIEHQAEIDKDVVAVERITRRGTIATASEVSHA